jgi:hypothetical protein
MTRVISSQFALLAFGVAIVAGLYAGNSGTTIMLRALGVMVAALFIGQLAAWTAKQVLREHLAQRKRNIDKAHAEETRILVEEARALSKAASEEGSDGAAPNGAAIQPEGGASTA